MDQPVVVVSRGGAGATGRHRLSCAGPLLLSLAAAACALLLLGASAPPTADGPRRMELLRTELMLRSANLVIKDLADEWDEVNFNKEPFDFCGKAHMTTRQVRVCADYFLGSLRDTKGDNTKATSVLSGIPKLEPFDKCMLGATEHAVRACIREVTRALTPAEMVHLSRAGTTGDDKELDAVGVHALETAKPDASLEGLNGGMDGKLAEMSSKKFLDLLPANGDASKAVESAVPDEDGWVPDPNCADLGMGGCDSPTRKGGFKPALLKRALDSLSILKNRGVLEQAQDPRWGQNLALTLHKVDIALKLKGSRKSRARSG